ncbi:DUF4258 domain-containing protein [Desulfofundulus salinus]|uniref:DUF4258 domain-containing protein n=1 Tax=Desulfofundulus salinus TaxID=2419843 RepID=A0A494WUN4_9FIRM|nr:DUF4258 domain-containing protein [Desulfofundulus salinum]RKO67149.1 DUF4258 domain-containing protein [Desulfofundulus salinum]
MRVVNTRHCERRIEQRGINRRGLREAILRAYRHASKNDVSKTIRLELSGAHEGIIAVCEVVPAKIRVITVYREGMRA